MYAVVGTWTLAPGRWDEQLHGLHEQVVPRAREVPGLVAAYWLADQAAGKTQSLVILEDEASARRFQSLVEANPMNREQAGVSLDSLKMMELVAEAHR
jgi:hypothetical protein